MMKTTIDKQRQKHMHFLEPKSFSFGSDISAMVILRMVASPGFLSTTIGIGLPIVGVKVRNMKMDLNIYGLWRQVRQ